MQILPSILEYSLESLDIKLDYIIQNWEEVVDLQKTGLTDFSTTEKNLTSNSESETKIKITPNILPIEVKKEASKGEIKPIHLHLDFVMEQFAQDRKVMKSYSISSVLEKIDAKMNDKPLILSFHLMGAVEDLYEVYNDIKNVKFNNKWKHIFFVPEKYAQPWKEMLDNKNSQNFEVGIWYDFGQWAKIEGWQNNLTPEVLTIPTKYPVFKPKTSYLLMTVVAGKSGQKLEENVKQKALEVVEQNPQSQFILDGGWKIDNQVSYPKNVAFVSYSGFWSSRLNK
jgi:pentose-5-phosphate-3-epimerase